jgi:hypothetical protein
MLRVLLASTCIAFVLGSASASYAAKKSRVLSLADMETSGNANIAPAHEARLHIPGVSYVHIRFTLPSDFKRDSVATVRLFFTSPVPGCAVDVGAISARRWRNGHQSSYATSPAGGFTETVGGATPVPDGQGIMFYKDFKLAPATTGGITGQRRNDTVTVKVGRNADTPDDTCGATLYLITGKLIYEARK